MFPLPPQSILHLLALLVYEVAAQQNTFQWGFQAGTNPGLEECGSTIIQILPLNGQTTVEPGPFAMLSYQPGGPTVSSPLTNVDPTNPSNFQWIVPHSPGAQVLLQVVDPSGNSGGIPSTLYTIGAGTTNSCHSAPSTSFKMTTTVTTAQTCDPIEVDFTGGTPPYFVTIVAQGSSVTTNDSTTGNQNEYTYINRAPPTEPLLIAAHDSTGQYALNTNLIQLSGPTDTTCAGKASGGGVKGSTSSSATAKTSPKTSSTAKTTSPAGTQPAAANTNKTNTAAIAGGAAGGAIIIIGVVVLIVYFCLRRRNRVDDYRPGTNQYPTFGPGKVADESFATRPMLPPSPQPMQDYGMNQYVFTPDPNDPRGSSVALQYNAQQQQPYTDAQSSSSRTESLARTPQSFMYAHNLPPATTAGTAPYTYPNEKNPQQYNQQLAQREQQYPPPQQQQQGYPPQQYAQESYGQQNYRPQQQQQQYTDARPPASVVYASSRLSSATSSSGAQRPSGGPLIPINVHGVDEEESELAYRMSSGSTYNNTPYQKALPPQTSSTSKQQHPTPVEPQVLQHRDAGPVLEIPPAYGDGNSI